MALLMMLGPYDSKHKNRININTSTAKSKNVADLSDIPSSKYNDDGMGKVNGADNPSKFIN